MSWRIFILAFDACESCGERAQSTMNVRARVSFQGQYFTRPQYASRMRPETPCSSHLLTSVNDVSDSCSSCVTLYKIPNQYSVDSKPQRRVHNDFQRLPFQVGMKIPMLLSAAFLAAALTLSQLPSPSEGSFTFTSLDGRDDEMFEFARAKIDKVSTKVRKSWRVKSVAPRPDKRRKVVSTGPNNQYLSARIQVDKAMAEARGMQRSFSDRMIKSTALLAARSQKTSQALTAVGFGLYNDYQKYKQCEKARGSQRCKPPPGIVDQMRSVLGDEGFDDLMSVNGDVSLVFAIDTTGSMREEIAAAKNIIHAIASYQREGNVNYILSPFNDPGTGPVTKYTIRNQFKAKVNGLRATGGGDCKELTMHGIIDAINKGSPRRKSPIFVFTDAGPKDEDFSEEYNTENAAGLALDQDSPINFFFSKNPSRRCQKPQTFESFQRLIEETEAVGVMFDSDSKISNMSDVVMAALDGMATIKSGGSGRRGPLSFPGRRRPVSRPSFTRRYAIPVDETVDKLVLVITVQRHPQLVKLRDPRNHVIDITHPLSYGAVWVINRPRRGRWGLVVPSGVGSHSFKVSASSRLNIDFDHYFFWTLPRDSSVEIPITHPLENALAKVKLLIPLKEKLNINSLIVDVIRVDDGTLIKRASLRGITASFRPPSGPFKLRLRGLTARGFPFTRISRNVIRAKPTIIRMVYNRNYLTLQRGRARLPVRFAIHNNGPTAHFDYRLTTTVPGIKISQPRRSRFPVSSGKHRYFSGKITVSSRLSPGTLVPVVVTAKKRRPGSKIEARLRVHFIVTSGRRH